MIKIKALMKWYAASPTVEMVFCAVWVANSIFYGIIGNWPAVLAFVMLIVYSLIEVAQRKVNYYAKIVSESTE
jgi:hypothetical protein